MDLKTARSEWDAVPTIIPRFKDRCNQQPHEDEKSLVETQLTPSIMAEEATMYLRSHELSFYMSSIEATVTRRGVSKVLDYLFGNPKLSSSLEPERNELFAIALCPLNPNDAVHNRMLQTVYKGLTGHRIDCPRYGRHWEQVGFQGCSPDTDLRGVGMLGLLHLVNLAASPQLAPLARAVYCASLDPHQGFPLAVLSLNLTKSTLQALREGALNRECNKYESVTKVVLLYHAALFSLTLRLWQSQHCTVNDCGLVIKQAEMKCKKKVDVAIQNLREHVRKLSLPERCSPRARFVQAGNLHQLATQAQTEFFI